LIKFNLTEGRVQILEFKIEGVFEPRELEALTLPGISPSKPLVISGRGPQWLYQYIAHHYHYVRLLATYEPRINKGIVIEAPATRYIGKAIDPETGDLQDQELGADGKLSLGVLKLGAFQLVRAEVENGKLIEPFQLRQIDWQAVVSNIDPGKPVILYVMAPIWLGAKIAIELSNLTPWYAVYDPRLQAAIVIVRHVTNAPKIGSTVKLELAT